MTERIHLSLADVTELEEQFVLRALRSGWVAPLGPDVDAFEREVAEMTQVRHALALSSGTAALHLALIHLGAGPNTIVLVPSLTFAATANAVTYTGAQPMFVDSNISDGNIDPDQLIRAIDELQAEGRSVAAAITVDLFGRTCDYPRIERALAERSVPLLEDAAEAVGSTLNRRPAGSFGAAGALSFNGNKIMTTSGGGMLLSDDESLIAHARKLSTQAREPVPWYEHNEIGYNYRLSNILAALGRAQLRRLPEIMERRQHVRAYYQTRLKHPSVRFLGPAAQDTARVDNNWLTTLILEDSHQSVTRIIANLNAQGIEARHMWKPLHMQTSFAGSRFFGEGSCESLFQRGITLPSGTGLTASQLDTVSNALLQQLET